MIQHATNFYYACYSFYKIEEDRIVILIVKEKGIDHQRNDITMKQDALNVKDVNFREIKRKIFRTTHWKEVGKKQIKLNDESIKRLIDMISKSKNETKKFKWKNITSVVFNLKRALVTIKHISCAKNLSQLCIRI